MEQATFPGHSKTVIWLTGLSGAGKTTLARAIELALSNGGNFSCVLDGDEIRHGVNADLGFSPKDRTENNRRVAEIAKFISDLGLVVIVALISPRQADRDKARAIIESSGSAFFEVFVDTPLEVCEKRDAKGLYKQARARQIKRFTGVHASYEEPLSPDIAVHPAWETVEASVAIVMDTVAARTTLVKSAKSALQIPLPGAGEIHCPIRKIDANWLNWTRHNLKRQCAPTEIRQILLDNGFASGEIKAAMGASYPVDDDIDYKALAGIKITRLDSGAVKFESDEIQLYTLESYLADAECDELVALINQNLRPSTVTVEPKEKYFRTSSTCYLSESSAPIVAMVDRKIAETLGISLAYSEPIQGQKYLPGQQFKPHTDFFEPRTKEYEHHCQSTGNRTWTFMIYLTTVELGGGTAFQKIGKTFRPKKGMAVVWNNLCPDGTPNRFSLHSGEPVVVGEKVIITKWFREKGAGSMFAT